MIIEYATKQKKKAQGERSAGLRELYRDLKRNRIRKLLKEGTH